MKKYRLKKWYPSLPKDWEEGIEVGQGDRNPNGGAFSPCNVKYTDKRLPPKEVKSAEFWEEVVEKDYEILTWSTCPRKADTTTIYSVKRLSDEIVFSVGDSVNVPQRTRDFYKKDDYTISSFKVWPEYYKDDKLRALIENGCHIPIDELSHRTKPIFTTEDGVDIFEGDKYWAIYTMADTKDGLYDTWKAKEFVASGNVENYIFEDVRYFSTKEAAEKYISENKPMYTLKDIERCVENWGMCKVEKEHIKKFLDNRDK